MSTQMDQSADVMPADLVDKGWKLVEFKTKPLPWQAVNPVLDLYGEPRALPDLAIEEARAQQIERDEADAIREEAAGSEPSTENLAAVMGESAAEFDQLAGEAIASPAAARTTNLPLIVDPVNGTVMRLGIDEIRTDGGTQPRASLDMHIIADYCEAMKGGAQFPPVEVFWDGEYYWLADGFHRLRATEDTPGKSEIVANVREGTQRDAVLYSLGANATHGQPRSPEDKRRAVTTLLEDDEWKYWSNRSIAEAANVSHTFVGNLRHEIEGVPTVNVSSQLRKGKDGRTIDTTNIGATAEEDDRQTSISEIAGGQSEPQAEESTESEGAQAQAIKQANEADWSPAEFVEVLKRHGGVLYKRQLEEMGCTLGAILYAVEQGAIIQPETGKFTLPDYKPQPSAGKEPSAKTSTATPAKDEKLFGKKVTINELLKGRMLVVSFTWLPAVIGMVNVSVNVGGNAKDASRRLLNADHVRGFSEPVLEMINTQLGKPAAPKVVKKAAPMKSASKPASKKPAAAKAKARKATLSKNRANKAAKKSPSKKRR